MILVFKYLSSTKQVIHWNSNSAGALKAALGWMYDLSGCWCRLAHAFYISAFRKERYINTRPKYPMRAKTVPVPPLLSVRLLLK